MITRDEIDEAANNSDLTVAETVEAIDRLIIR